MIFQTQCGVFVSSVPDAPRMEFKKRIQLPFFPREGDAVVDQSGVGEDAIEIVFGHTAYNIHDNEGAAYAAIIVDDDSELMEAKRMLLSCGWEGPLKLEFE